MGLDIVAWEHATLTTEHEYEPDECWEQNHVWAYALIGFEHSTRGLETDRCYVVDGESIMFRAGSYSGYGEWRDALAQAALDVPVEDVWAAPEKFKDKPFYELLNFADNEGTIGPQAAANLAEDFNEHRTKVLHLGDDEYFTEKYEEWTAAFDLAAGNGIVVFG